MGTTLCDSERFLFRSLRLRKVGCVGLVTQFSNTKKTIQRKSSMTNLGSNKANRQQGVTMISSGEIREYILERHGYFRAHGVESFFLVSLRSSFLSLLTPCMMSLVDAKVRPLHLVTTVFSKSTINGMPV